MKRVYEQVTGLSRVGQTSDDTQDWFAVCIYVLHIFIFRTICES